MKNSHCYLSSSMHDARTHDRARTKLAGFVLGMFGTSSANENYKGMQHLWTDRREHLTPLLWKPHAESGQVSREEVWRIGPSGWPTRMGKITRSRTVDHTVNQPYPLSVIASVRQHPCAIRRPVHNCFRVRRDCGTYLPSSQVVWTHHVKFMFLEQTNRHGEITQRAK